MFDFKKCEICKEKKCKLSFLQKSDNQIKELKESELLLKKLRELRKEKLTSYWKREKKSYRNLANNEMSLINYNRKPYMNDSDWIHDSNWFICIQKLMELDDLYYKGMSDLYSATIQDLI